MPDSEPPLPPPAGSPPDSPDVLEELEADAQQLLESQVMDSLDDSLKTDSLNTSDLFDEPSATPVDGPAELHTSASRAADIADDLDGEVFAALEEELGLFGSSPRAAADTAQARLDAELFGPEAPSVSKAGAEVAATVEAGLSGSAVGAAAPGATANLLGTESIGGEEAKAADREREMSEAELFGSDVEDTAAAAAAAENWLNRNPQAAERLDTDLETQMENDEGAFDARTSRYMKDAEGNLLYKWKVEYAPRGGGGVAQCRDSDCLERHAQGGVRSIEKGCLRIGRRVLMDPDKSGEGKVSILWHHARCMFNTFLRARNNTRIIETVADLEGFSAIAQEDQDMIRRIIEDNTDIKNVRFRAFNGQVPTVTPTKRGDKRGAGGGAPGTGPPGAFAEGSAAKKRREAVEERHLGVGDRVWTHFRCLPRDAVQDGAPPGVVLGPVKSEKPELATIREESADGTVIVQFESEAHEKDRTELYKSRRGKRLKGWLRYPRLFEGKKQRVPLTWVQWKRNPPSLCGCTQQSWGHRCDCGISCGRGVSNKVYGVGDTPY